MAKTRKLLVIGGTGFIGHHLLSAAIQKAWHVSSLSLHPPSPERYVPKVSYFQGDLLNQSNLKEILYKKEFNYVVNLGGYINHKLFRVGGRKHIDEHFTAIQNLISVLSLDRIERFIQIGSSDEYGYAPAPQNEDLREAPISPYSLGKVAATHFLQMLNRTESFPVVILRLFLTYGPGQDQHRFLPQIIRGCLNDVKFPTSSGEQLRDFCFIEDIIKAIFLALEKEKAIGEVMNIASGEPISIYHMINNVKNLIGKGEPSFGEIPYRSGENMSLYADIQKAQNLLRWEPKYHLNSGLQKTISWYAEKG